MGDLGPDLVFVVSGDVWRDFKRLREETGDALCNGFDDACVRNIRAAIKAGDPAQARHWKTVKTFGTEYGLSWVSAVEVDGELIREHPKYPVLRYPDDGDLARVVVAV